MLTLRDYGCLADRTARQPDKGSWLYEALAIGGELGELLSAGLSISERLKKHYRRTGSTSYTDIPIELKTALLGEMGDVLWYMNQLALGLGSNMENVAQANLDKLAKRKAAGELTDREGTKE